MIGKMKYFIRRPWASQLTLNNQKQIYSHYPLSKLIRRHRHPHSVVCEAMCWADTPQRHVYWSRIANDNYNY